MQHTVQRQMFTMAAPNLALIREWERKVHALINEVINPCIAKCFDEVADESDITFIRKIEIDLGVLNDLSESEIRDKIIQSVSSQIQNHKSAVKVMHLQQVEYNSREEADEKKVVTLNRTSSTAATFAYFLIHGRLPWWVDPDNIDLKDDWIIHLSSQDTSLIAREIASYDHAVERLIYQFDLSFIITMLKHYNTTLTDSVVLSWKWFEEICRSFRADTGRLYHVYWSYWVRKCMGFDTDDAPMIRQVTQLINNVPEIKDTVIGLIEHADNAAGTSSSRNETEQSIVATLGKVFVSVLRNRENKEWKLKQNPFSEGTNSLQEDRNSADGRNDRAGIEFNNKDKLNPESDTVSKTPDSEILQDENVDSIYCDAAGLVIVHPFLKELFTTAGLLDLDHWSSPSAQHQAVFLTAWLAYGETDVPEYNLTIPKLLCGMPSAQPLDTSLSCTEDLYKAGEELLSAIIKHWNAVGNTSIDGLREGFIRRPGKLVQRDDGWKLTVERKTLDILLTRLPWSISFIRLPWLAAKKIYVDWT